MIFKWLNKARNDVGLLWQALKKFIEDNGFFLSSGIAFNILISLIPFIMLLLALNGTYLHNDEGALDHFRAYSRDVAPTLGPKVAKTLTDVIQSRHTVGILGCVGLLWIATRVFRSLRIALNIVFGAQKRRAVLRGIVVDFLVIVPVGILLFVSMILTPAVIFLQSYQGRMPVAIGPTIQWTLRYLLPFALTCCMFFLIYKIAPNKKVLFTPALQGALFAGLLWELAKHLFARYVLHLARYSIFLRLIKHVGHFRFVGVLFCDDSRCWRGVCLFPGRRSTKIDGLTRSTQAGQVAGL
jgi:membrane protein